MKTAQRVRQLVRPSPAGTAGAGASSPADMTASPDRTTALHIGESDEQMETDKPRLRCRPGAILRCERFSTFSAVIKLQMGISDAGSCVPQGNQTACRSGNGQAGVGY